MNHEIAVIGLGYVGLPLALEFSKKYPVTAFDNNPSRVEELLAGYDRNNDVAASELANAPKRNLVFSAETAALKTCTTYIITVPTPVDKFKQPDLSQLLAASTMVAQVLQPGNLVIYESTVYPGCTEEECIPVLEQVSGLAFNVDFFCGYSPERINPGDKINTLTKIKKVTSGSTPEIAEVVDRLYASIIEAGTHKAPSIKVAEASKAIENAQRDVNISFVNELALIFDRMGIDTQDVLDAAATKWNFLKFKPGLVGGHCIGVDPYYLAYKAGVLGYQPQVILSGRMVNDRMGQYIASKVIKLMTAADLKINGSRALVLGITFKENCADIRNSRVIDIVSELQQYGLTVDVYDPLADANEVVKQYQVNLSPVISGKYAAIILAVAHDVFKSIDFSLLAEKQAVIFDSKGVIDRNIVTARL